MASGRDGGVLRSIRTLFDAGAAGGLADAQLLERFVDRRDGAAEAAFEALVVRHGPMVLDVCRNILRDPHDAQDAFQATFLILARKANAIRRRDALGSWLYGVARRVATRARSDAARRRSREHEAALISALAAESARAEEPRDLSILHEEVNRLPRKYLDAVVLCDLGGLTYEDAARQLRCPVGTIGVRLKRARERLRDRLCRRGLTVLAGLCLEGSLAGPAAALTPALVRSTVRIAMGLTSAEVIAPGAIPATILTLSQGVLRSMFLTQIKLVGLGAVSLCLVVFGAGTLVGQQGSAEKAKAQASTKGDASPRPPDDAERELRLRIVALARRRLEAAMAYYTEGRTGFTIDRLLDAVTQMKNAEVQAAVTRNEKIAALESFSQRLKTIEDRERTEITAGRGTEADATEASLHREQAEMELRRARLPAGPLDLESLDRRLSDVERKLDLILKALPPAAPVRP